ncbi:TetR/AcrR family transcriptional regulator [Zavarzinia marina]|uniref:TetR/AcrR family transcriptional regulator n=1 Tax=Zavarzinia marina TaxID=2911065 RepID=UPI0022A8BE0B|nr:TetR/AcrR family transcriptional regulator [Zavarzinia marina]
MTSPAETRRRIVQASIRLFAQQGVGATTTKHIAAEARIAEGTIYRHFPSKEAMADAIFLEHYLPFADALQARLRGAGTAGARIAGLVGHFYEAFDRDRDLFSYLLLGPRGATMRLPVGTVTPISVLRGVIASARVEVGGGFPPGDDGLVTAIVLGMILQPAESVALGEEKGPLAERAAVVVAAIGRVLGLDAGAAP